MTVDRGRFLERRIRIVLLLFMAGLVVSGLTAFPLEWELRTAARLLGAGDGAGVATLTGGFGRSGRGVES